MNVPSMMIISNICGVAAVLSLVSCITAQDEVHKSTAELMLSSEKHLGNDVAISKGFEENVLFYLYTRTNLDSPRQILINNVSSLILSGFDTTKNTLVVIHGYRNNLQSPVFQEVKNGALASYDFNIIGVAWDHYTESLDYGWVVEQTKPVGVYVSKFIGFLIEYGLSSSDLHLIGHSLGAHVAGFVGKQLTLDGHAAARITGLDPALPGFYNYLDASARLNASDAQFVDCIHTCGGILGIPSPICQADFFPNRGQNVQPGCSLFDLGACSHGRSFEYFAESFNRTHLFKAQMCESFSFWIPYNCHDGGALMGYPAGAQRQQGLFSLVTNSRSPFAKDVAEY